MNKQQGFSLTESLIVAGVITVLVAASVPSVLASIRSYRLRSAAQTISQTLEEAKYDAVRTNGISEVHFNTANQTLQIITKVNTSGGTQVNAKLPVTLPDGVKFASMDEAATPPEDIEKAVNSAGNIPGQAADKTLSISFAQGANDKIRVAVFTSRGLPGKPDGRLAEPGVVNWVCLVNDKSKEKMAVTISGAGSPRVWKKETNASWVRLSEDKDSGSRDRRDDDDSDNSGSGSNSGSSSGSGSNSGSGSQSSGSGN